MTPDTDPDDTPTDRRALAMHIANATAGYLDYIDAGPNALDHYDGLTLGGHMLRWSRLGDPGLVGHALALTDQRDGMARPLAGLAYQRGGWVTYHYQPHAPARSLLDAARDHLDAYEEGDPVALELAARLTATLAGWTEEWPTEETLRLWPPGETGHHVAIHQQRPIRDRPKSPGEIDPADWTALYHDTDDPQPITSYGPADLMECIRWALSHTGDA